MTGIVAQLRIRKKTRELAENKTIWWFVIHGDEQDLCTLDDDWDKVHLQTNWRLENCFAPSNNSPDPKNFVSDPNSPSATGTTDPGPSVTEEAETTIKDTNTTPIAADDDGCSSATTLPTLLNPNQLSPSIPNGSNHSGNSTVSAVNESPHV